MRSTYRPPPGMSAGARRPVRAEKDLSPAHADLVPHSSRVALGNHRKRCDLMRIETAGGSHIWPSLPRSRNRPKGLRTAEVGGSNPLTSTSQAAFLASLLRLRPSTAEVAFSCRLPPQVRAPFSGWHSRSSRRRPAARTEPMPCRAHTFSRMLAEPDAASRRS